jgi:hypothetical protein
MEECGVELVLTGHLHHGYSGDIRPYYPQARRSIIIIQAGTSISTRTREHANAYNLIQVSLQRIEIQVREWDGSRFEDSLATSYVKERQEWKRRK